MVDPVTVGLVLGEIFGGAAVAGALGTAFVMVTTIVVNLAIAALLGKLLAPKMAKSAVNDKGIQNVIRDNVLPRRIIYGEAVVGGPYAYIETTGTDNEWLNMVVILAAHPVEDIVGVFINDTYVNISDSGGSQLDASYNLIYGKYGTGFATNHVKIIKNNGWGYADHQYVTDGAGNADAILDRTRATAIGNAIIENDWDAPNATRDSGTGLYGAGEKLTNCAHIFVGVKYNRDVWSGFPQLKFHVKGKRLYNPSLDSTSYIGGSGSHDITDPDTFEWSEDWSLCVLDYLLNTSYGMGAKIDEAGLVEIDWQEAIDSYTASSEVITTGTSNVNYAATGPRFTINGVLETSSTPISNMEAMLTSGAGAIVYAQGKYKLRPGIYREPSSPNDIINEDMIVSALSIRTHTPRSEIFNKAAGVYVDKGYQDWYALSDSNKPSFEPNDFEIVDPVDSSGLNPYELIDGEEIIREFDFPLTTRPYEAQRLARIQLERIRQGLTISFEANLKMLKFCVGDTVYLEILNDAKYANESFFNRLGLDDTVQNRPDSPFTPYYKQFKILDMQYTNNATISVMMTEESEEIYDWNNGDANVIDHVLVSEIISNDPTGTVLPPTFSVSSPYDTITEDIATESGTTVTTLIRWSAVDRGSSIDSLDRVHTSHYVLEYGQVTDPSQVLPEDRVATWISGGAKVSDHDNYIQGPLALETLYKDGSEYDFRIRAVTYSGRRSVWAYYSEDIGSDYAPSAPPASSNDFYYIKPINGTAIKNGTGTLTVEAHLVSGGIDNVLSSPYDVELYDSSTYRGSSYTYDTDDITGSLVVELRENTSPYTVLDTITLVDIDDGLPGGTGADAYYGYIEATNGLAFTQAVNGGTWNPTATATQLDFTVVQGGVVVAQEGRTINRSGVGVLTDGGSATHSTSPGNFADSPGSIGVVVTGGSSQAATVTFTYTNGADSLVVAETVITSVGADDGATGQAVRSVNMYSLNDATVGVTTAGTFASPLSGQEAGWTLSVPALASDGDIVYVSTRTFTDDTASPQDANWSTPTIYSQRTDGTGGATGQAVRTVNMYNLNDNTVADTSGGTFASPISGTNTTDGWTLNVPGLASDGDIVYVTTRTFTDDTASPQDANWSATSIYAERTDGIVGTTGQAVRTVNMYNLNDNSVADNNGSFASPISAGNSSDGWTLDVPALASDGDVVYVTTRTYTDDAASPQDASWATPTVYSQRTDGATGQAVRSVNMYSLNDATVGATTAGTFASPLSGQEAGWTLSVPALASDGDIVYVSTRTFTDDTASPQDANWSTPTIYSQRTDGTGGATGQAVRTVNMYNLNDNTVADTSGGTFASPISGTNTTDGWTLNVPGLASDGDIVYVTTRTFTDDTASPQDANWSATSIYAERTDGIVGTTGQAVRTVNMYNLNDNSVADNNGSFASPISAGNSSDGWTLDVPALASDGDVVYVTTRTYTDDAASPQDASWATPTVYSQRTDGATGQAVRSVNMYSLNDATVGATTAGTFASPLSGQEAGWTLSVPALASDGDIVYVSTRTFTDDTASPQDANWSTPTIYSQRTDGTGGATGQAVRTVNMYNLNDNTVADTSGGTFASPISGTNTTDGWTLNVPGLASDGDIVYVTTRTFTDDTASPQDANWSATSIYAERTDGIVGTTGQAVRTVNMYNLNDNSVADNNGSFASPISAGNSSDGWTLDVPALASDGDVVYVTTRTYTDDAASPQDASWATPTVYSQRTDGVDALTISYTNSAHTVPVTNRGIETWTGSGGELTVWEGNTALTLDQNTYSATYPTTPGEYRLSIARLSGDATCDWGTLTGATTTEATLAAFSGKLTTVTVFQITAYIYTLESVQKTLSVNITITPADAGENVIFYSGTNINHSVPVTTAGAETWTGSGGDLQFFDGPDALDLNSNTRSATYPATPAGDGSYNLEIVLQSGDTLTIPTLTGAGTDTTTLADWAGNLTTATVYRATAYIRNFDATTTTRSVDLSLVPADQGATGAGGSNGSDGHSVSLTAATLAFTYDDTGANPTPANSLVTAAGNNFSSPQYRFLVEGSEVQAFSTTATYTYVRQALNSNMPEVVSVEAREGTGAVEATDALTMVGIQPGSDGAEGDAGTDAITVVVSNEAHTIPVDKDGNNGDYTGSGTTIRVYEGVTELLYDGTGTASSRWKSTPTDTGITVGSPTDSGNYVTYGVASAMTADTADIDFLLEGKRADGTAFSITKTQTFSKSYTGATGAGGSNGSDGHSVSLTAATLAFTYDDTGANPTPANSLVTAAGNNFSSPQYRFLVEGSEVQAFSTTATYTYVRQALNSNMPEVVSVEAREGTGAVEATDALTMVGIQPGSDGAEGDAGTDAITVVVSNEAHTIPVDKDGNNGDYTGSGTTIRVYEGVTELLYDGTGTASSRWKSTPTDTGITVGSPTDSGNYVTYGVASAMTADTADIDFLLEGKRADGTAFSITKTQTFSKSYTGATGAGGSNGSDGHSVSLTAATLAFTYDDTGANPTPANSLVTAAGNNFSSPQYRFLVEGSEVQAFSTTATYTYVRQALNSNMPEVVSVEAREGTGAVEATDALTMVGIQPGSDGAEGDAGTDAITVVVSNEAHTIPVDKDGNNGDYTGSGTTIRVYEGVTELLYDGTGTASSRWKSTPTDTGITVGSPTDSGNYVTYGVASAMTADTADIDFLLEGKRADGTAFSITKTQTFSKSYTGATGAGGATGQRARTVSMYKIDDTTVGVPGAGTFASPLSGQEAGWTLTVPSIGNNEKIYVSTRTFTDDTLSPQDASWSTPSIYAWRIDGTNGTTGDDGLRTIQGYLYYEKTTASAPAAPSGNTYTFSTGVVSGTGINDAGTTNTWRNEPRPQDPTSGNDYYTVRYYGTEASAGSSTIAVTYSNVVVHSEFSGVVRFTGGTEIGDDSTTYDPAADVNANATTIDGGKITALTIDTGQLAADAVTAAKIEGGTITADELGTNLSFVSQNLILGSSAQLYTSGKTSYGSTTAGVWLGYDAGAPAGYKFNIGSSTNYLKWTGSALSVKGDMTITGGSINAPSIVTDTSPTGRTVLSSGSSPISVFNDNNLEILSVDSTTDLLELRGTFATDSITDASMFSEAGIDALHDRLGSAPPTSTHGGTVSRSTSDTISGDPYTGGNTDTGSTGASLTGELLHGSDNITLKATISGTENYSESTNQNWTTPVYVVKWQYSSNNGTNWSYCQNTGVDVSETLTGTSNNTQIESEPGFELWTGQRRLSATASKVWTGHGASDTEYLFRVVVDRTSATSSIPSGIKILSTQMSEPLVGTGTGLQGSGTDNYVAVWNGSGLDSVGSFDVQYMAQLNANETVSGSWSFTGTKTTMNQLFINESTAADSDVTGDGQVWVRSNAPNDLYFTNDVGVDYPVGYATYRRSSATVVDNINQTLNMTTDTVADALVGGAWIKTGTTAYTLTLEPSTDTQFPVGSQISMYNRGASGNMVVVNGSGTTLYVMTGSASTVSTSADVAPGGYATVIRESTTVYVMMGAGVTA